MVNEGLFFKMIVALCSKLWTILNKELLILQRIYCYYQLNIIRAHESRFPCPKRKFLGPCTSGPTFGVPSPGSCFN